MSRDAEHLKLLAIFHFVLAGLVGMTGMIGVFYAGLGVFMLQAASRTPSAGSGSPPTVMGGMLLAIGLAFILIGLLSAGLLALAGWNLSRRKGWTFCFFIACVTCMWAPLGTALGICTILVLNRQSVKDLFDGEIIEPTDPEDEEEDRPGAKDRPAVEERPTPPGDDGRYHARGESP